MNKPGIYQIRNTKTSNVYIGSSSNIARRWTQHKSALVLNKHEESIEKIKASNLGQKRSQETKDKLKGNKNCQGRKLSQEHIEKLIASRKGIKHTEEALEKMSLARKGKPWSIARRAAQNQGGK